jgi:deoxyribonuclease I
MRTLTNSAALAALLLGALAACKDDPTRVDPNDLGLPASGQFAGTVDATGDSAVARFVAGRSGPTSVKVCSPEGTNFDITVNGTPAATSSNCEQVTFNATAGFTYRVAVKATAGTGPFNGCYSGTGTCDAPTPSAIACNASSTYYAAAAGKTGPALIQSLHDIIAAGHRVLGYTQARESLYAVIEDPDNDNVLTDVYVGRTASGISNISTASANNFNAEHSWPQSRGANEDPANSDVNILFPSDASANTQRSNNPFGEVVTATWTSPAVAGQTERSRLGLNANGVTVFEPRDSKKGDIARALLYFYVRYKSTPTASFTLSNFNLEEATLLKWAAADPPSAFEIQRNELVFRTQGNRNPFIDCPSFVTAVGDLPNSVVLVP